MTISIEHVGVWVNDLGKMKSFYEKYFNAVATKNIIILKQNSHLTF